MSSLVKCRTLFNETKYVPAESMIQRPSVYGVVIHEAKLLVAKAQYTKLLVLPGGGIDKGERIEDALKREMVEETGITVEVGEFLHFQTDFFYYDPHEVAIHGFLFIYRCTPLTFDMKTDAYPEDEGLERPLWVDISTLDADSFQSHGSAIMRLLNQLLNR